MITEGINILKRDGQFFILKVLNFFSPRSFFFIIPAKREGSINPFFKLLDSFSKNIKML
jgi:hypothetical protein